MMHCMFIDFALHLRKNLLLHGIAWIRTPSWLAISRGKRTFCAVWKAFTCSNCVIFSNISWTLINIKHHFFYLFRMNVFSRAYLSIVIWHLYIILFLFISTLHHCQVHTFLLASF
jgi:hypothetical protein